MYSILCCIEETKNNDGQPKSDSKREKISKNAVYYYCSFSVDLAAILFLLVYFNVTGNLPDATLSIIKFLQFSNSLVNVIIYPFRISEFKNALRQIHCSCACECPRDRNNEVLPMHEGRLGHFHYFQEIHIPNHQ